jgi:hypothetical protein
MHLFFLPWKEFLTMEFSSFRPLCMFPFLTFSIMFTCFSFSF